MTIDDDILRAEAEFAAERLRREELEKDYQRLKQLKELKKQQEQEKQNKLDELKKKREEERAECEKREKELFAFVNDSDL